MDDNSLDEIAQDARRARIALGVVLLGAGQGRPEILDLPQVALHGGRMQRDDVVRRVVVERGCDLEALGLERPQPRADRRDGGGARGERVDEAADLTLDLASPALQARRAPRLLAGESSALGPVCVEIVGDQRRMPELGLEAAQHGRFDRVDVIAARMRAGSALAHARAADARLAGAVLVVNGHTAPAHAAAQQARQEPFRAARQTRRLAADPRLARGDGGEDRRLDDRQVRRRDPGVLARRIRPRDAAARVGVLDHPHLVPDDLARVERVLQDPRAAPRVAVQGRGVPRAATRRRHGVAVERGGDGARRLAGGIGGEDATDDRGLALVDRERARRAWHRPVAVGAAAGVAAVADDPGEAAAHLLGAVLALQLADEAKEADRRRVERRAAGMDGANRDAEKAEPLVQVGKVAHVARQAIGVLDDEYVEVPPPRPGHQIQEPIAAEHRGAGLGAIGVLGDDGKALADGEGAA